MIKVEDNWIVYDFWRIAKISDYGIPLTVRGSFIDLINTMEDWTQEELVKGCTEDCDRENKDKREKEGEVVTPHAALAPEATYIIKAAEPPIVPIQDSILTDMREALDIAVQRLAAGVDILKDLEQTRAKLKLAQEDLLTAVAGQNQARVWAIETVRTLVQEKEHWRSLANTRVSYRTADDDIPF